MDDWKLIVKKGKPFLYNLKTDIHEDNDVALQHPDIVEKLKKVIFEQRIPNPYFSVTPVSYTHLLQGIDAALITCNANLIYTYGCVVSGYLYLPLHSPALLFFKRPNNITGEHSFSIRKPEQIVDLLKEKGLPIPAKLMLEGDELPYSEYCRLAS